MVCDRCKMVVESELRGMGLHVVQVSLGEVELEEQELSPEQLKSVGDRLPEIGFELIGDRKAQVVERLKIAMIALIREEGDDNKMKHSEYLSQQLGLDYPYLSRVFSEGEGLTIEQYIIRQKIERVKELISYGELTLSEIAWQMGYSSVAALSNQFRKAMNMTPSKYRSEAKKGRMPLDKITRGKA